jgi:hypothetical protein
LGINFEQPTTYKVSISTIDRSVEQTQTVAPAQFSISGKTPSNEPLTWGAIVLPDLGTANFRQALQENPNLSFTVTSQGLQYESPDGLQNLPEVTWVGLSQDTGTTPATVTVTFSDTNFGSPLHDPQIYQATILVWQNEIPDDRFRFVDVAVLVSRSKVYVPLIRK